MRAHFKRFLFLLFVTVGFSQDSYICVSIIVKNNESTIWACLKSASEIADCISICDIGSTDRTRQLIDEFFKTTGIPGKIHQRDSQSPSFDIAIAIAAAQKTLKTYSIPLSNSYLLVLDPDQVIAPDSHFKEALTDDSYLVLEKSLLLSCINYSPNLFKASLSPEIISSNAWLGTLKKAKNLIIEDQLPAFLDDIDAEDDEYASKLDQYKKEKLKRSIEVYSAAVEKNPENTSHLLWLAQSYKALHQFDEAIALYKKRIDLGGDPEEIWFSKFMIGECNEEMGLWVHALYWYLEAYQYNPNRADSLRKIATYYRVHGQNDIAYLFAKHGLLIPKADGRSIYPNPPLYDYQFDEEISIAAFYTRFKENGYEASSDLLLRRDTPYNIKEQGYRNILFYVQNLKARYVPIRIPLPLIHPNTQETYHPMNPSIQLVQDGYKLICRSVNYTQVGAKHFHTNDPEGIFRTRNFLIDYDKDFNILKQREIVDDFPREQQRTFIVQGLEDCRIFDFNGAFWFTCSTWDTNPTGAIQISLCKIQEDENSASVVEMIPLKGPDPNRHEKNWLPFTKNGDLRLIYSYDPLIINKPDLRNGECTTVLEQTPAHDFSRFRGSAGPIPFDGGYLVLIHEVVSQPDFTRCYLHRFVFLDANFIVKSVTKPFTFNHNGIEYCLSMTLNHEGDQLVLPIGIEDNEAYLAFVDLDFVRSMLKPLPMIYPPY